MTKDLFVKYPTVEAFANADLKELERDIHSTGFYHNKAKNIIACTKELLEKYKAPYCAKLVLEAAEIYEKRGILL